MAAMAGLWPFVLPLTIIRLLCLVRFNIYLIHWRFVGLHELKALLWCTTVSSLLFYALLVACRRWDFPRGVLVIDWLLNVFLVGGLRISYRLTLSTHPHGAAGGAVAVGPPPQPGKIRKAPPRTPPPP